MKKISTVVLSAVLAMVAGQVAAQTNPAAAHAAASASAQAAKTAATPANKMPAPVVPVIKNLKAAQSLEIERSKFHIGALDKFQKCVGAAKVDKDIPTCQVAYREALANNVRELASQGKFDAAYEVPVNNPVKPAPAKSGK